MTTASDHRPVPVTEELLAEIVSAIVDGYDPERIILFGSRATGNTREWSDVDLLVIKETDVSPLSRIRQVLPLVRKFKRAPYHIPIDVVVRTPGEMQERLAVGDPFLGEIVERGRELYGRADG